MSISPQKVQIGNHYDTTNGAADTIDPEDKIVGLPDLELPNKASHRLREEVCERGSDHAAVGVDKMTHSIRDQLINQMFRISTRRPVHDVSARAASPSTTGGPRDHRNKSQNQWEVSQRLHSIKYSRLLTICPAKVQQDFPRQARIYRSDQDASRRSASIRIIKNYGQTAGINPTTSH